VGVRALIACLALPSCSGGAVCGPFEVEGPDGDREVAQDEADRFLAALVEPICIRRFAIDAAVEPLDGSYRLSTRTIEVYPGLGEERLRHVVRHELCHAVQDQRGFDVSDTSLWYGARGAGQEHEAEESFADTCAVGPFALALASESCLSDPQDADVFALVAPLFRTPEDLGIARDVTHGAAVADAAPGAIALYGATIAAGDVLRLDYADRDGRVIAYVDLWTGAPRTLAAPSPTLPAIPPPGDDVSVADAVTPEAQISAMIIVPGNGADVRRLALHDGDGWARLGCPSLYETTVAADDELWWVLLASDAIRWGTWSMGGR
jgi:hypothetical protein